MPHVSKRVLKPEIKTELTNSLSFVITDIKTKTEADTFLSSVLTDTEIVMVAKRIVAAYLLKNKIEEKSIGETLKLTPATITRLKMWISLHPGGFDKIFSRLDKKSSNNTLKVLLNKFLKYASSAAFGYLPKRNPIY